MATPKNCVFCTTTNRIIDFIPDDSDCTAAIVKFTVSGSRRLRLILLDEGRLRRRRYRVARPRQGASPVATSSRAAILRAD